MVALPWGLTVADLIPVASGLLGVAVGGLLARRSRNIEAAFALHREFHAPEFEKVRDRAQTVLLDNHPLRLDDQKGRADGCDLGPIFSVMEFYERVSVHFRYGKVHPGIARTLFGQNFVFWNVALFEGAFDKDDGTTLPYDLKTHLDRLDRRLRGRFPWHRRRYATWVEQARAELERLLEMRSGAQ